MKKILIAITLVLFAGLLPIQHAQAEDGDATEFVECVDIEIIRIDNRIPNRLTMFNICEYSIFVMTSVLVEGEGLPLNLVSDFENGWEDEHGLWRLVPPTDAVTFNTWSKKNYRGSLVKLLMDLELNGNTSLRWAVCPVLDSKYDALMNLSESEWDEREQEYFEWLDLRDEKRLQIYKANDHREFIAIKDTYFCPGIKQPLPVQVAKF